MYRPRSGPLSRLWKDVPSSGAAGTTTLAYDENGNLTTSDAPLARTTRTAYDELNRLSQVTDPINGNTTFGYDSNDNLASVTDPRNLTTSYAYNGFGDQVHCSGWARRAKLSNLLTIANVESCIHRKAAIPKSDHEIRRDR